MDFEILIAKLSRFIPFLASDWPNITYKCLENGTWDNSTDARERFDDEVAQCLIEIEKYIRTGLTNTERSPVFGGRYVDIYMFAV